jgi:hypothetical protein
LAVIGAAVLARRRRNQPLVDDRDQAEPDAATSLLDSSPGSSPPSSPRAPGSGPGSAARASWLRPGADVDRAPGAFIAVQTFGPMAILALLSTPIFGGVKHFMPAMPYVAVAAACGLAWVIAGLGAALRARGLGRRALPSAVLLSALVCVPAITETERSRPDGLSHYNMIAGGFAGGASLGMNRQFWAYCVLPMLDWVNHHAPENQRMYWHDVIGDALGMYKREGRLDLSVGDTGSGEAGVDRSSIGLMVHEKHWALYEKYFWDHYGTLKPVLVREREGVPLVIVYERPRP